MSFSSNLFPNPMEESYRNPKTNRYTNGPGDDLDDDQQPGMVAMVAANRSDKPPGPQIIPMYLRNIEPHMTDDGIQNLCRKWGKPQSIKRFSTTTAMVWFKTLAECETVISSLNRENSMGIQASFAKSKEQSDKRAKDGSAEPAASISSDKSVAQKAKGGVDWSRRTIKGPFAGPTKVRADPRPEHVTAEDYLDNENLRRVDPEMNFCENEDRQVNGKVRVHKFRDSPEYIEKMKNIALASGGKHTTSPGTAGEDEEFVPIARGPCNVCRSRTDKRCERCGDFYCTVRCQRMDWPEHRRICFPMPRLVTSPQAHEEDEVSMPLHINTNGLSKPSQQSPAVPATPQQRSPAVYPQQQSQKSPVVQNKPPSQKSPGVQPQAPVVVDKPLQNGAGSAVSGRLNRNAQLRSMNLVGTTNVPKPATPEVAPKPTTTIYPAPATNSSIIITYVVNHRKVYVRSGEPVANQDYIQTQLNCAEYEKTAPPMRGLPSKGDILLAKFDGLFYRALVLNVMSAEEIEVGFIDFGNKASVSFSDTKTLSAELQARPRHTIQVLLDGLPEKMTNEKILLQLNDLMDNNKILKIVYDPSTPLCSKVPVLLIDPETGKSINQALIDLDNVKPTTLSDKPIMIDDLEYVPLEGEQVEVVVLENSLLSENSVWCVRKENLTELIENNDLFQEYCAKVQGPYTPRVDEMCLVFFAPDHCWYRAVCTEVAGDGQPAVRFVDFGNNQLVPIENIRKMPEEFAYRRVTVDCTLFGISEISETMLEHLMQTFTVNAVIHVDKAETMKLAEFDSEFSQIRCDSVLDELRKLNLLL